MQKLKNVIQKLKKIIKKKIINKNSKMLFKDLKKKLFKNFFFFKIKNNIHERKILFATFINI